ncbi:MAG: hypothetical protein OXH28_01025 [bacterium]|nr:hypothetical protein [bacterium]
MNENRRRDPREDGDGDALGDALGEAVGRETDSPIVTPPVTDIAERAAALAKARRVRHGVVSIAAAAALIAGGLAAWNTLGSDTGDGNIQVATQPAVPDPTAPEAEPAEHATGESGPAAAGADPADLGDEPAADSAAAPAGDESSAADRQLADPTTAEPVDGAEQADPGSTVIDSSLLAPEELSTGPTLTWIEVAFDTSTGLIDVYRMESVGDGRIVALAWGDGGNQVVVTTDGTTWTAIDMPDGIYPDLPAIGGDRWVVGGPDTADPQHRGRVFFSDDQGATWTELSIDVGSGAGSLPPYCVRRARVTAALASGDRMVAVVETHSDLDLQELLVAFGHTPDRDSILHWRYTDSALVVYLGEEADAESVEIPFDELGLAPGQSAPCAGSDGQHDQRVHLFTSDGAGTEPVGRYDGANTSAISTVEGFFITLRTGEGDLLLTSPDGRAWTEHDVSEQGYVPMTRGPDGAAWRSARSYDSYRIERLDVGRGPGTAAEFEGLRPGPILTAGPAGVVTTAEPIAGAGSRLEVRIVKDGYELRLDQAWGDLALWDLAADVAVYEFAAPEIMFRAAAPDGLRIVTEDDGSQTLVFEDPDTGDDLVAFTAADLERNAAQFTDGLGTFEPPPTWIGWSASGTAWGWQNAVDGFGIDIGGTSPPPIELAVGEDFVLARVHAVTGGEAASAGGDESQPTPPRTSDARWFIAPVP